MLRQMYGPFALQFLFTKPKLNGFGLEESMKTCLLFTALLTGPHCEAIQNNSPNLKTQSTVVTLPDTQTNGDATETSAPTRAEIRDLYRDLLKKTARREHPNPYEFTESLVALHRAIGGCERMSHAERTRLHTSVEGRLKQLLVLLKRDIRRLPKETGAKAVRDVKTSLNGPAEIRNAMQLINLIQATIEPDSWDVNGGKGSIQFYSPLNVLVIRNTSEVHGSVGGGLQKLR